MLKYLVLAVVICAGMSQITGWVYAGATDRATCIDAMVSGKACDRPAPERHVAGGIRSTGAKTVINQFYPWER